VVTERKIDARQVELPLHETVMEHIGKSIVLNICMLGAVVGLTKIVKPISIMKVLQNRIPAGFLKMNREALNLGMKLADSEH
jgi:2-oxoglutarate ferredoxin oxidoreductase subunit gamma